MNIIKLASIIAMGAITISGSLYAHEHHIGSDIHPLEPIKIHVIDHQDYDFRMAHPVRVFLSYKDNKSRSGMLRFTGRTEQRIAHKLPANVILVDKPEYADIRLRVSLTDYDLRFHITDTDRKDKKYKKSRRHTGGKCGYHRKAYYTKVKEKGIAHASYKIKVSPKGEGRTVEHIRLRSAENYSYGTKLMASTACGIVPTRHFPSNGVAELFDRGTRAYRDHVATEIRREAADDLGIALTNIVLAQANQHYVELAHRLSYHAHVHPSRYYNKRDSSYRPARYTWRHAHKSLR